MIRSRLDASPSIAAEQDAFGRARGADVVGVRYR